MNCFRSAKLIWVSRNFQFYAIVKSKHPKLAQWWILIAVDKIYSLDLQIIQMIRLDKFNDPKFNSNFDILAFQVGSVRIYLFKLFFFASKKSFDLFLFNPIDKLFGNKSKYF